MASTLKDIARPWVARAFGLALRGRSRPLPGFVGPLLVVAPHPDDETLGCGGLIARQAQAGGAVHVVFVTDGEASHAGHPTVDPIALGQERRAEALAALATLGVASPKESSHFLAAPDGRLDRLSLDERAKLEAALRDTLRSVAPAVICVPFHAGGSTEHTAVFSLAVAANRESRGAIVFEYPVWGWWNAFRLRSRMRRGAENFRLWLGPLRSLKRRALACHRTQVAPTAPWTTPQLSPSLADACCGPNEFYFGAGADATGPGRQSGFAQLL